MCSRRVLLACIRHGNSGNVVETERASTFADGLSTWVPMELSLRMMKQTVDEILLVSEEELRCAVYLLLEKRHNLVEGAGAAHLAAALKMKDSLRGKNGALILSGANLLGNKLRIYRTNIPAKGTLANDWSIGRRGLNIRREAHHGFAHENRRSENRGTFQTPARLAASAE